MTLCFDGFCMVCFLEMFDHFGLTERPKMGVEPG